LESPLEAQIGALLRAKNLKLVLAESCTGGLIGHRVTNIPGSSEYYLGSVTAYAYEAKERLLGVKHDTLIAYGAVSRETAIEMARGVRQALSPDFGIDAILGLSVTGIAGPGGGTPTKPVGLVWIGLSTPSGDWAWSYVWPGDREQNKADTAEQALKLIKMYLLGEIQ
jgi:PncC family amidohydrolase